MRLSCLQGQAFQVLGVDPSVLKLRNKRVQNVGEGWFQLGAPAGRFFKAFSAAWEA